MLLLQQPLLPLLLGAAVVADVGAVVLCRVVGGGADVAAVAVAGCGFGRVASVAAVAAVVGPRNVSFGKAGSTLRSSRAVPHPSTNRALRRLTSEVRRDPVYSTRYGRRQQGTKISHTLKNQGVWRPFLT